MWEELRKKGGLDQIRKPLNTKTTELRFLWPTSEEFIMFPFFTETYVWELVRMEWDEVG